MKFKVIDYESHTMTHRCLPADCDVFEMHKRIDLLVSGDLPEGTKPEDLIGKIVEIDTLYPSILLGLGVKIVN